MTYEKYIREFCETLDEGDCESIYESESLKLKNLEKPFVKSDFV